MIALLPETSVSLPTRIARLSDLAQNLWWCWQPLARTLFRDLDHRLWSEVGENPILLLDQIDAARLVAAAADPEFLRRYDEVVVAFDGMRTTDPAATWIGRHEPELVRRVAAYFSAEFGLHQALPIYSGGLGVLAGDHLKTASDLGLPLIGVSLLYRQGYLRQRLSSDGWQLDVPANLEPRAEPTTRMTHADGSPLLVSVTLDEPEMPIQLAIWRVDVGRCVLYLLDADVEGNPEWTRTISSRLYGGDQEHRLRQEIILGIGGVRALRAMSVAPDYWHANEGHAAFSLLERVRELVTNGQSFAEAVARVRATTVFTTHTPVPAGHDVFPPHLMDRYFSHLWTDLGVTHEVFLALGHHEASGDGFNLTALALRLADYRNAVSQRHGEISRSMWHDLWPNLAPTRAPIASITNGVHLPTWIAPKIQELLDRHLPHDWRECQDDPATWEAIARIDDAEFWQNHLAAKRELMQFLRERRRRRWIAGELDAGQIVAGGPFLESEPLTIGFARRFAMYKRATLLFHDVERLTTILTNPERPVQLIFAGKAHPADDGGKRLIQEVFWRARDPRFEGRIAFVEDYDMGVAARLVAGVDVWLNNPRAPLEASGTSGMKAGANGVANLSVLDGWWLEGWRPPDANGWGIPPAAVGEHDQDAAEATAIYDFLEQAVVPRYYTRDERDVPMAWVKMAKQAITTVAPSFSAQRMVIDYIRQLYLPAARAAAAAD